MNHPLPSRLRRLILCALSAFATQASLPAEVPTKATNVNPIEIGSEVPAPLVRLPDGGEIPLDSVLRGRPTVVVFYRGGWCPYCTRHLEELADLTDTLQALGFQLVGLSPDHPDRVREALAGTQPTYRLFSDAEMHAARAFGLAFKVDAETYARLEGFGIDLEAASGQPHRELPVPAVFLVDAEGMIAFRYYNPDYRARLSGEALLEAARTLVAAP
jgi:peroxiredoxin